MKMKTSSDEEEDEEEEESYDSPFDDASNSVSASLNTNIGISSKSNSSTVDEKFNDFKSCIHNLFTIRYTRQISKSSK